MDKVTARDVAFKLYNTMGYVGTRPIRSWTRDGAELTLILDNGQRFRILVAELDQLGSGLNLTDSEQNTV